MHAAMTLLGSQVSAMLMVGTEGCFCTGAEAVQLRAPQTLFETAPGGKLRREMARLAYTVKEMRTPFLPVVNGTICGAGFGLLQVSDLVFFWSHT